MCSVEENGEKAPIPHSIKSFTGAACVKCGKPGVLITRIHDSFCKDCFQVYVVHKFRSAIGKSKLIRDGETVLVAYSGGVNSSALLHLIQDGLSHRAHKRLRFTPTLLHIDDHCLFGSEMYNVEEKKDQIRQIMLASGFPSCWIQLEQSLTVCKDEEVELSDKSHERNLQLSRLDGESAMCLSKPAPEKTEKLQSLISSVGSSTAQEDFVRNLRNQLLVVAARQLAFSKILTAETSTRLAIRILSGVAQGRGSQVSLDTGISDERNGDVMFMRPVRDLNAKELALYNNLFGVESVFTASLATKTGLASSIDRLTQTFVCGLQAEFPSTVSNIVRTSEKLGLPNITETDKCRFCQSPLDTNVGKASALSAVLLSEKLSRASLQVTDAEVQGQGLKEHGKDPPTVNGTCNGVESAFSSLEDLKEALCYGCRLSLHDYKGDVHDLPPLVTKPESVCTREKQREQLSGFLFEDDGSEADEKR